MELISEFFAPGIIRKLLWYYQEEEKVELPEEQGAVGGAPPAKSESNRHARPKSEVKPTKKNPPKKHLFLTCGTKIGLKGKAVYVLKCNAMKNINEDNVHKVRPRHT